MTAIVYKKTPAITVVPLSIRAMLNHKKSKHVNDVIYLRNHVTQAAGSTLNFAQ